ncbi:LOW QUALITY PROTEIN: uncharacterized protein ACDL77_020465 [Rhynchocyon petersi]
MTGLASRAWFRVAERTRRIAASRRSRGAGAKVLLHVLFEHAVGYAVLALKETPECTARSHVAGCAGWRSGLRRKSEKQGGLASRAWFRVAERTRRIAASRRSRGAGAKVLLHVLFEHAVGYAVLALKETPECTARSHVAGCAGWRSGLRRKSEKQGGLASRAWFRVAERTRRIAASRRSRGAGAKVLLHVLFEHAVGYAVLALKETPECTARSHVAGCAGWRSGLRRKSEKQGSLDKSSERNSTRSSRKARKKSPQSNATTALIRLSRRAWFRVAERTRRIAASRRSRGAGAKVLLHVLFEHAVGYAVLALKETPECTARSHVAGCAGWRSGLRRKSEKQGGLASRAWFRVAERTRRIAASRRSRGAGAKVLLHVLFEHAVGYAVLALKETPECTARSHVAGCAGWRSGLRRKSEKQGGLASRAWFRVAERTRRIAASRRSRGAGAKVLLHVLFEHAVGYAVLALKEVEEISLLLPQVEQCVLNLGKFHNMIRLVAFCPFTSSQVALENANAVSEGIVHEDLCLLLETNLPSKKKKVLLGVGDPKIGAAIQEELEYTCQTGGVIAEILRGIRLHFHNLVKGLTDLSASKAQLGLGHSYSRAKVKFNVNQVDDMIIQSISLLDQLDKDINTFCMRVREWYGYHFPKLVKFVNDNATYCRLAQFIGNRKELNEDKLEKLEELTMDEAKAKAILDASRASMGMDISAIDLINIESFSSRVVSLSEYCQSLHTYLRSKMSQVAPSLSALIGEAVGARLIAHAGSLTNLAKYPASTVQILGAEKALFRALKTRGNTSKYGLIFHSTFIDLAAAKNKGRISRYLANKCSIASRIDCFSEVPTSVFGEKLREQVEERLSFYETGEVPWKNLDVMKEAMVQAEEVAVEITRKLEKKEKKCLKKEKKRLAVLALMSSENNGGTPEECDEETEEKPQKKKKKRPQEAPQESGVEDPPISPLPKPKKKKSLSKEPVNEFEETVLSTTYMANPPPCCLTTETQDNLGFAQK